MPEVTDEITLPWILMYKVEYISFFSTFILPYLSSVDYFFVVNQ